MQDARGKDKAGTDLPADEAQGKGRTARQQAKEAADKKAKLAAEEAKVAAALQKKNKVSKAQRDREADARRGPPPPPKRNFRAPTALLPDVITVWELLQVSLFQG